jgi:hypothetical protein
MSVSEEMLGDRVNSRTPQIHKFERASEQSLQIGSDLGAQYGVDARKPRGIRRRPAP